MRKNWTELNRFVLFFSQKNNKLNLIINFAKHFFKIVVFSVAHKQNIPFLKISFLASNI